MKKNRFTFGWFFVGMIMAFGFTACDDDETTVSVTFPEKQVIGGQVTETKQLSFDAPMDWQLTSSSTWCQFYTENGNEYSLSGKAGKQTVGLYISNEGQGFDDSSVALITLSMNGQEAVIAEVTRNPMNRELKLFKKSEDGTAWVELAEGESLIVPRYNNRVQEAESYAHYMVQANFRFAATNCPEWLTVENGTINGGIGQDVEFGIKMSEANPNFYKYAQTGSINFQDEEGKAIYTFPVSYEGMDTEEIKYVGPNQWNWEVSLDGKTFIQTSSGIAGTETSENEYRNFVEYTVTAFNDEFMPIYVEEYVDFEGNTKFDVLSDDYSWIHLQSRDPKSGKARITVDNLNPMSGIEERMGYVFVFPKALYNNIIENPENNEYGLFEPKRDENGDIIDEDGDGNVDEITGLRYEYTESNLLMNVIQKERKQAEEGSIIELISQHFENSGETVECTELTGEEADVYKETWHAKHVFTVKAADCKSVRANVQFDINTFAAWGNEGNDDVTDNHCALTEGETKSLDIWGCEGIDKELQVVIRDAMYQEIIVLVIRP